MKKTLFLALLLLAPNGFLMAATGTINTVAGNGTNGYNGDGILATSADLNSPYSVATDSSNNIYICDFGNNRVRKVTVATGLISTVAGNGTFGYNGDGIPAASAELESPIGISVDPCGNLYFAEYDGNRIRKVDAATGLISTVAGNGTAGYNGDGIPATSAELNVPHDTALDSQGRLYIADRSNYRCRRVDFTTGLISTVAGSGSNVYGGDGGTATSAGMGWVEGVWVDAAGNIYLAISADGNIRKVTAATGIISTFATGVGYPLCVFGDCGGNIFVGTGDAQVYEVNSAGVVSTAAGNGTAGFSGDGGPATSAQLDYPCGVNVDTLGDLLIVDNVNARVRLVQTIATPCPPPPCGTPTPTPTATPTSTATSTPTATPVPTLAPATIQISDTVSETQAQPGDLLTYTVILVSPTGGTMGGQVWTIVLPPNITYVSGANGGIGQTYNASTRTITWVLPNGGASIVGAGFQEAFVYQAQVDSNAPAGSVQADQVSVTFTGQTAPATASAPVTILSTADIFTVDKNLFNPAHDTEVTIFVQFNKFPGSYGLRIYNSAGEHIRTLDSQQLAAPVSQTYTWDGANKYGDPCASGVYIIYLEEPYAVKTKRILLVR